MRPSLSFPYPFEPFGGGTPKGLPLAGLVTAHHFYYPNLALYPSSWDNAAWTATNVTVTPDSIAGPDGDTIADTLTATADNGTVVQSTVMPASATMGFAIWIKRKTGTGDIKIQTKSGTSTTVVVTDAWQKLSPATLAIGGTAENNAWGIIIATSGDAVYVCKAQLYPSATLPDYQANTDLQSLVGAYGTTYGLQRGSTVNGDTNDPSVSGPGALFETNDYYIAGSTAAPDVLPAGLLAGPMTVVAVFNPVAYVSGQYLLHIRRATTDDSLGIYYNGPNRLAYATRNVASGITSTGQTNNVTDGSVNCVALIQNVGGSAYGRRLDNGLTDTTTAARPKSSGAARLNVGAWVGISYKDATWYSLLIYSRVLAISEQSRALRALRAFWLPKGVTF